MSAPASEKKERRCQRQRKERSIRNGVVNWAIAQAWNGEPIVVMSMMVIEIDDGDFARFAMWILRW